MICFLFVCRCNPLSNAHWCLVFGQYICWNGQRCAVVSGRFRNRRIVSYFSCAGYTNNNDLAGCRYIAGLQTNLSKMGTQTKKQCIEQTCQQRRCRSALRKGALLAARIVPKRFLIVFFSFLVVSICVVLFYVLFAENVDVFTHTTYLRPWLCSAYLFWWHSRPSRKGKTRHTSRTKRCYHCQ